jgi:polyphosphate kinase
MTLYRVGKNSPIVKALIEAAKEGKQVTAVVELKARFDEQNNLKWAKALEDAGAHVIYGIVGLKIHAKAALVVKQTRDGIKQYAHLSTGNYNPATSRIYTDLSFFTADQKIAADLTKFFHHITGFSKKSELDILSMSPLQIKPKLLDLIAKETVRGKEGEIIAKMNSLVDDDVITALYKASQAGVKISLIIRGICCLRPGVKGVSDTIRVVSIVGKYLEHTRSFFFKHAEPQVYFSSADWMPRNLVKRIELLTPVFAQEIANSILEMMVMQLNDNVQARELQSDGTYIEVTNSLPPVDSQTMMEKAISKANQENIRQQKKTQVKIQSRYRKESK